MKRPIMMIFKNVDYRRILYCFLLTVVNLGFIAAQDLPNFLVVIADDLGVDYTNGYGQSGVKPTSPTLDSLQAAGITFKNVFSNPKCSPSRAGIMTGKYGIKNGVSGTPGNLSLEHKSIFLALKEETSGQYDDAVIGKWHISSPADPDHPMEHGIDYYMGFLGTSVEDYYAWSRTENGETEIDSSYVMIAFTDAAINWVDQRDSPWFLWYAYGSPHSPLHIPPSHLYTVNNPSNNPRKYPAMIESIDYELNRLLQSIPDSVMDNTIIIYLGDNGTPNNLLQNYQQGMEKTVCIREEYEYH